MKVLYYIALTLVIIGAINWLLIGLFNFDLVATIFGAMSVMSRIIYVLVGIAGLISIGLYPRINDQFFNPKEKMILYKNFAILLLVGAPPDSSKGKLDLVFNNIIFLYNFSS